MAQHQINVKMEVSSIKVKLEADRYLLKAVRTAPFFVSIAEVPFFLTLPLHIRRRLNHIALEVDIYRISFSAAITFPQEM